MTRPTRPSIVNPKEAYEAMEMAQKESREHNINRHTSMNLKQNLIILILDQAVCEHKLLLLFAFP